MKASETYNSIAGLIWLGQMTVAAAVAFLSSTGCLTTGDAILFVRVPFPYQFESTNMPHTAIRVFDLGITKIDRSSWVSSPVNPRLR